MTLAAPKTAATADPAALLQLVESRLRSAVPDEESPPTQLHRAMRQALFAGGKRIRPLLVLSVAEACAATGDALELATLAACAVEMVHAASLVHDDLPCFDNADERRGRPSIHKQYGEALAVLVGDALLCRAFHVLALAPPTLAARTLRVMDLLGQAAGSVRGIIAGQSLELERDPDGSAARLSIDRYHTMKTAALFRFATEAGAVAAGACEVATWTELGQALGLYYQLADDLCDVRGDAEQLGKPLRADDPRCNSVHQLGESWVLSRMQSLLAQSRERVRGLTAEPHQLLALLDSVERSVARALT